MRKIVPRSMKRNIGKVEAVFVCDEFVRFLSLAPTTEAVRI